MLMHYLQVETHKVTHTLIKQMIHYGFMTEVALFQVVLFKDLLVLLV